MEKRTGWLKNLTWTSFTRHQFHTILTCLFFSFFDTMDLLLATNVVLMVKDGMSW